MGPPEVAIIKNAGMYTVAVLAAQQWMPSVMRFLMNRSLKDDKRLRKSLNRIYKYLTKKDRAGVLMPRAEPILMACLSEVYA